jgi:predicted nucleic acid-binding protein
MQEKSEFKIIISDTTCIIVLSKTNNLNILEKMYKNVYITPDVLDEFREKSNEKLPEWIILKEPKNKEKIAEIRNETGLGKGECSSIVLGCENISSSTIIIDDDNARKYAQSLELNVLGTCGVIIRAKEKGIIKCYEEGKAILDDLIKNGLWVKDNLYEKINYLLGKED